MKTKEHSRQVKEKVVEKFKAGLGCKTISKSLKISHSSVEAIVQTWKEYGTTASLPGRGRPPKQRIQSQRVLFTEALKRPVVILEKLPRSTAQQGRAMDGVGWSSSRSQGSFRADTLSRLASFIARTDAKQHAANHPPSRLPLYGCQECGKGFPYPKDVLQHQEQDGVLPKPHRCTLCGQQFSLRSSLQLHRCNLEADGCSAPCAALLSHPGRLQETPLHRQPHLLDSSPYACAPCGRGFSQKQALLHHQQAGCSESPSNAADARSLPDDSPPVSEGDSAHSDFSDTPGPSGGAVNACRICSRTFCSDTSLRRHFLDSHAEETPSTKVTSEEEEERTVAVTLKAKRKLLSCRSCDMVFRSTSQLYMHRKEKHRREKLTRREARPIVKRSRKPGMYPCQICSKVFGHHLTFRAHCKQHKAAGSAPIAINDDGNSADCAVPDSQFLTNGPAAGLGPLGKPRSISPSVDDSGEESEREDSEFPCPSCPKVFSTQQQLKEHIELHQASVRQRQCSVCACEMDGSKGPASRKQRLYHCVPCQQGFSALDSFLEHCQEHLRVRVEVEEQRLSLQPSKA
ncbi:PREDICTED: zinc finger protein 594-like isoform X1 [Poecilia mexicana]|uniref:C2H2-type domain-containing protein n=1 Tax=Poecilia mexicana TaxID=48701 RepID=A0A3B3XMP0_9TELE|nr:PREDICTED: zinc finger protein 594-like isoform X1 [Poecilia mexicana]XP_014829132.1 PREDICTED: zinc finger protein 594-like isoform X1 [Poecilia mexicana]